MENEQDKELSLNEVKRKWQQKKMDDFDNEVHYFSFFENLVTFKIDIEWKEHFSVHPTFQWSSFVIKYLNQLDIE